MPKVTYITHQGVATVLDVPQGETLMRAALDAGVDGIVGQCGGAMACATCHVFVDEAWLEKVGPPSETEEIMLESTMDEADKTSRLSCQITMSAALDGVILRLPKEQA
jgi:2Fe-2S ferredoxin